MFLFYREKTGEVVMRSEELQTFDNLKRKKITPTAEEQEKIKQGWNMKIKGNAVEFTKPEHLKEKPTVEELKALTEKATTIKDLKDIINKLI